MEKKFSLDFVEFSRRALYLLSRQNVMHHSGRKNLAQVLKTHFPFGS